MDALPVLLFIILYFGIALYVESRIMTDKTRDDLDKLGPFL